MQIILKTAATLTGEMLLTFAYFPSGQYIHMHNTKPLFEKFNKISRKSNNFNQKMRFNSKKDMHQLASETGKWEPVSRDGRGRRKLATGSLV